MKSISMHFHVETYIYFFSSEDVKFNVSSIYVQETRNMK